jgi:hypothetical protein
MIHGFDIENRNNSTPKIKRMELQRAMYGIRARIMNIGSPAHHRSKPCRSATSSPRPPANLPTFYLRVSSFNRQWYAIVIKHSWFCDRLAEYKPSLTSIKYNKERNRFA